MILDLGAKPVILELVVAFVPDDFITVRVHEQVAVLCADGAVAVADSEGVGAGEGGDEDFVLDGFAVAGGFVPGLFFAGVGFCHGRWSGWRRAV